MLASHKLDPPDPSWTTTHRLFFTERKHSGIRIGYFGGCTHLPATSRGCLAGTHPDRKYLASPYLNGVARLHLYHRAADAGRCRRHINYRCRDCLVRNSPGVHRQVSLYLGTAAAIRGPRLCYRLCVHRLAGVRRTSANRIAIPVRLAVRQRLLLSISQITRRCCVNDGAGALPLRVPVGTLCIY